MQIKENQTLTPDKANILVTQIQSEISNLSIALKNKDYNSAAYIFLQNTKDSLQSVLDNLLNKRGIVTPNETNNALDMLNKSKKARLEENFIMGIRKSTFYLLAFAVLGVATYLLIKKNKK